MGIIFSILVFNFSIEILRFEDPNYYLVKEVKIKKLEECKKKLKKALKLFLLKNGTLQ